MATKNKLVHSLAHVDDLQTEEDALEFLHALGWKSKVETKEHAIHNQKDHAGKGRSRGGSETHAATHKKYADRAMGLAEKAVMDSVMGEYLSSNLISPMAPAATDARVGAAQVEAIASGETTWSEYESSNFSDEQLTQLGKVTTAAHVAKGIPFIIEGHESEVSPAEMETLKQNMDKMLAQGMPRETAAYRYSPELGVAIVSADRFSEGYENIKERVFLTNMHYAGLSTGKKAVTAENAARLDEAFKNRADTEQLTTYYKAAQSAVDIDNPGERSVAAGQRDQYDRSRNPDIEPGFRVTPQLDDLIDRIDTSVTAAWNNYSGDNKVPKSTIDTFIDDVTRRNDQPTTEDVEEHAVHNQKDHAGKGGGGRGGHQYERQMDKMSPKQQKAVRAFMKKNKITHKEAVKRVLTEYESAKTQSMKTYNGSDKTAMEYGSGWYKRENGRIGAKAKEIGVPKDTLVAMTAAVSPRVRWELKDGSMPNLEFSTKIALALKNNVTVDITPKMIREWKNKTRKDGSKNPSAIDLSPYAGKRKLSELPSDVVARIGSDTIFKGKGSITGWPNVDKAVRIYRGESADTVLTAPKTRSFNEQLQTGGRSTAPVIDRHMTRIATGQVISEDRYAKLMNGPARTPRAGEQPKSGYSFFSDVITDAAQQAGVSVADMQSVSWNSYLGAGNQLAEEGIEGW